MICFISVYVVLLSACNIAVPDITPTPEILITETLTLQVSPSSTTSPIVSPTITQEIVDVPVIVASPLPTQNTLPVVDVTPTATQGPCEVTIQEGETLSLAVNRNLCGNAPRQSLIDAVVAFNDNITNPDVVSAGLVFFVPLPTPTPIPEGADMTQTVAAEQGISVIGISIFPVNQEFGCHTVEEGDSIIGIADRYNTTLEILSPLNPSLNWGGCDFTNPSGGPNCNPGINPGLCVQVPFPTSTPVPTTTPSGRETATPTPTQEAAIIISPPEGSIVNQRITLEWVSVGILRENETYLIDVEDRTSGTVTAYQTRNTRYILPDSLIPSDGQTHTMAWRVRVAVRNDDNTYTPVGGTGAWNTFQWQSR